MGGGVAGAAGGGSGRQSDTSANGLPRATRRMKMDMMNVSIPILAKPEEFLSVPVNSADLLSQQSLLSLLAVSVGSRHSLFI